MDSVAAIGLLLFMFLVGAGQSKEEQELSFKDNFTSYKYLKVLFLLIALGYCMIIYHIGANELALDDEDPLLFDIFNWLFYFVAFGLGINCIIFSKNSAFTEHLRVGAYKSTQKNSLIIKFLGVQ
ncbi:hypothetical protein [Pseudoalteromonas sp. T1lg23B]|uniref:hypothetical protein n=1 Tax=Pseudoalteromonas sp. T1lg23B TaxID=2077097 RepID=UPI000CF64CE1|nr:hypothetical protein [Pseudoalteromonas sp. T1lg23B]